MLRLIVLCAVAVSLTSVFVAPLGGIEHATRATPRVALHAKEASDRDGKHGNTNETPMMAILVGLALGDLTGKIFRFLSKTAFSESKFSVVKLTFLRKNWGVFHEFLLFFLVHF